MKSDFARQGVTLDRSTLAKPGRRRVLAPESGPPCIRLIAVREDVGIPTYYLYGRLSRCKSNFDLICLASCKHLSGVTRVSGAPKWGIRSRLPLQLVGLEGLDNSQARGSSVRTRVLTGTRPSRSLPRL